MNINFKYLVIAAVLLSILTIVGAYVYSLIPKPQLPTPTTQSKPTQATQSALPKPLIEIRLAPGKGGGGISINP